MSDFEVQYAKRKKAFRYFYGAVSVPLFPIYLIVKLFKRLIFGVGIESQAVEDYRRFHGMNMDEIALMDGYGDSFLYIKTEAGKQDFYLENQIHFLFSGSIEKMSSECVGISINPELIFQNDHWPPAVTEMKKNWGRNPRFIRGEQESYYQYQKEGLLVRFYADQEGELLPEKNVLLISPQYASRYVGEKDDNDLKKLKLPAEMRQTTPWEKLDQLLERMHRPIDEIISECGKIEVEVSDSQNEYYEDAENNLMYVIRNGQSCTDMMVPVPIFFDLSENETLNRAGIRKRLGGSYIWESQGMGETASPCYRIDFADGIRIHINSDHYGHISLDEWVEISA